MAGSRDDELAQTATAPGGASADAQEPLGATLGRYRLERMLGEGGMGTVHAAFDPDLERRVALKVLRGARSDDQARQRLLREARAMARLTHTNVVTVHEVGNASGRDYVAMELVDGGTLNDWLRASKRSEAEIVDAFVAAGRGLAAAHAAGLVHRDFKPHNVLVRRDGRICVTDFGLARGVEAAASGLETTVDLGPGGSSTSTPSSLSGLTATGSVLGTPAYMAPEQWAGGTVGPAADQFAYCVALWEALTGERPFRGPTLDELKREVARGPAELDLTKIPRRLRRALVRGLDPSPDKRWPNMDALLARISRGERRPKVALFAVAGAVVASAALYVALGRGGAVTGGCEAAALDPAQTFGSDSTALLQSQQRADLIAPIEKDHATWATVRAQVCGEPEAQRAPKLACLDGVAARAQAVHRAAVRAGASGEPEDSLALLVDPSICAIAAPPRLVVQPNEDEIAALAYLFAADATDSKLDTAAVAAFAKKPGLAPCARTIALGALGDGTKDTAARRQAYEDMVIASEECADDRLRAEALLSLAPFQFEIPVIGPKGRAAVEKAKVAVDRIATLDMRANLELLRAQVAAGERHWPESFAASDHAIAAFGERGLRKSQLDAAGSQLELRFSRNEPGDLDAVRAGVAKWKPRAAELHMSGLVRGLEVIDGYTRLFLGDVAGAHADIVKAWRPNPKHAGATQRIAGTVVDANGKPVAGAAVAVDVMVWADTVGVLPFGDASGLRFTTTDGEGKFEIADAPARGVVVASKDQMRAIVTAAPAVKLQLAATRRVAGKVELADGSRTQKFVMVSAPGAPAGYHLMAPLAADGTFSVDGAPTSELAVGVASWAFDRSGSLEFKKVPASPASAEGLVLAAGTTGRTLDVIARSEVSTPLDGAQVLVVPGRVAPKTVDELNAQARVGAHVNEAFAKHVVGEAASPAVIGKLRPGDLAAHFSDVALGDVTVCVIGFNGDMADPQLLRGISHHASEIKLKCEVAGPADAVVVVEAPPQKRFD